MGNNCLQGGLVALSRTGWIASSNATGGQAQPASDALDGNECTPFATGTNQASWMYFELNMGAAYKFSEILLDSANEPPGDVPVGYQVQVSADGSNWGSVIATGAGSFPVTTISFSEQNAQYILITLTASSGTNWWDIDEVKVLSAHPPSWHAHAEGAVLLDGDRFGGFEHGFPGGRRQSEHLLRHGGEIRPRARLSR